MAVTIDGTNGINDTVLGSSTPAAATFTTINGLTAPTGQYTSAEKTKLSGIETAADVTDSTNVLASLVGQEAVATGFTGTLDGILGSGAAAAATVTTLNTTGAVIFNEAGADVDFRVEGDTNANLFVVDASTDCIGIGTATPESDSILELESGSPGPRLRLTNTLAAGKSYKIHSNNSGELAILGNGNDTRLTINDSGNIGIGCLPASRLHIDTAGASYTILQLTNGTSGAAVTDGLHIGLDPDGTAAFNIRDASEDMVFRTQDSPRMTIKHTTGYVGIGVSAPVAPLAVVGGTSNATNLSTAYSTAAFNITPKSTSGYSLAFGSGPSDFPYIQMSAGGSSAHPMTINPYGGKVGIGTTSPPQKFVVSNAGADNIVMSENSSASIQMFMQATSGTGSVGTLTNHDVQFLTNNDEKMRITSAGLVGIGKTPTNKSLELYAASNTALRIQNSTTGAGSTDGFLLEQGGVDTLLVNYEAGVMKFLTSGAEAMRIDASGNVGIGTTSLGSRLNVATSAATVATFKSTNANGGYITYVGGSTTYIGATLSFLGTGTASDFGIVGTGANNFVFGTSSAEKMRITSAGNLVVGGTTVRDSARLSLDCTGNGLGVYVIPNTSAVDFAVFRANNGTLCGNIARVGVTGAVTYNTTSDYRLKNTIAPMTGALAKVAKLKPVTYKWKEGGVDGQGFIAHELQEVVPDAVSGEKDAVDAEGKPQYQGVDTSFVVATLTAAIQEQQVIIESLKTRITALEG